ncbi:hypothetical protein PoB_002914500 [Plakobranchus ocellatus]|uniref:Uncharacterized protein n=1 Tax=Plakobranchus ocellatus TaxID=259542 RepID=A0AAV4A725_9GAST|nr:hypothetical protein PoB_002914500 [Plakobranchus ocellatus]
MANPQQGDVGLSVRPGRQWRGLNPHVYSKFNRVNISRQQLTQSLPHIATLTAYQKYEWPPELLGPQCKTERENSIWNLVREFYLCTEENTMEKKLICCATSCKTGVLPPTYCSTSFLNSPQGVFCHLHRNLLLTCLALDVRIDPSNICMELHIIIPRTTVQSLDNLPRCQRYFLLSISLILYRQLLPHSSSHRPQNQRAPERTEKLA